MTNLIANDSYFQILLGDGDALYVPEGIQVITATSLAVGRKTGTDLGISVTVDGAVVSMSAFAVSLDANLDGHGAHSLLVGASGIVRALSPTNVVPAVELGGNGGELRNFGEISGYRGVEASQLNEGKIENYGDVIGTSGDGILVNETAVVKVVNHGLISGTSGVALAGVSQAEVRNWGHIFASDRVSGAAVDGENAGGFNLFNYGVLDGGIRSVVGSAETDLLVNHGTIEGDVSLGDGIDIYHGRGVVFGSVNGGGGGDRLTGGPDDDSFSGGSGADTLRGRRGDDDLSGEDGNDDLRGGRGDDIIMGNEGADDLRGGRDDDTFIFFGISDMAAKGVTDHILDFSKREDLINLEYVSDGPLLFMGAKAFKGGGKASISLQVKKGDTIVKIDVDGDGKLDGRFFVDDVTGLNADHFLL